MELHIRSGWFDGMVHLYAAEHSRGVASDEGDRLGMDESRQEADLPNYEDSTFRSRRPSSVEVSAQPPKELEESFRDDLDIGRDAGRALSTENEGGAMGIFESTGQDGSGDAEQFWHDEGVPDSLASAVKDQNTPRRREASMPTSSRIVLKFRVCGWPEDTWDPALVYILMASAETTDMRLGVEVPRTVVMDPSGVSASTSVSIVVVA